MAALVMLVGAAALFATATFRLRRHGFRFRVPPRVHPDHRFDPARSTTLQAGARIGGYHTSRINIEVDRGWMSIGVLVTTWIERYHVIGVRSFCGLLCTGLVFDSADGRYPGVVLWPRRFADARATFADHSWPVAEADRPPDGQAR